MLLLCFTQHTKYFWITQKLNDSAKLGWNNPGPRICNVSPPSSWCICCVTFPGDIERVWAGFRWGTSSRPEQGFHQSSSWWNSECIGVAYRSADKVLEDLSTPSTLAPVVVFWFYNLEEFQALYNFWNCLPLSPLSLPPGVHHYRTALSSHLSSRRLCHKQRHQSPESMWWYELFSKFSSFLTFPSNS